MSLLLQALLVALFVTIAFIDSHMARGCGQIVGPNWSG